PKIPQHQFFQDTFQSRVRMSVQTPPQLLDLAGTSLLRDNEASAITALEYLPTELVPPLFLEAFFGRRIETLKALVQVWPFVRLPLGGLMHMPQEETFQAVLDGLDVLLAQKVRPRRCRLRVLDLRNTGQNFWSMWSGARARVCPSSWMAPAAENSSRTKQHLASLEVFTDLCLEKRTPGKFLTYLLRWVQQRKGLIHLRCKKLKIVSMPVKNIMKVLSRVQLDCLQEVEVDCTWRLSTLARFAPLLGQMTHVQRLRLSHVRVSEFDRQQQQQQQQVVQFTSQILRLHHLRDLHLESPSFLEGRLDQMLRCLKTPLDNLSVTNCLLTESDLSHLSRSPNISQLKGLDLSGISLSDFCPELLQGLLEKVAATLQELNLEQCGVMDPQLDSILPALSRCSQLSAFSLCGNRLSMAVMGKLLRCTAGLPRLREEFYPAPRESYGPGGALHLGRLAQLRAELIEIMRGFGGPRAIWLSSSPCPRWGSKLCSREEPFLYHCYVPA
ncbi:PRAME family member 8-like, partial [Vicugna pacos]|uniref:PRAME family member 8-like n=1 Tax=Vicugna pacos TaxID=30538 RepID=A0ABM5EFQ0_VICPA